MPGVLILDGSSAIAFRIQVKNSLHDCLEFIHFVEKIAMSYVL